MASKLSAYISLTKPRILTMVLVTTATGFFLAQQGIHPFETLLMTLLGTGATCAGSAVLNNYLERDSDSKMKRTRKRPIPLGVVSPTDALILGILLVLAGTTLLVAKVNLLTGFLALLTAFLYVLVYTPLKKVTWLNTVVGAIPGALPPMGGWSAATGEVGVGAWILFFILFLWQHPHFYSIAWIYRDDFERGGFKMLPVVEPDGKSTFRQVVYFSLLLIPVSILPSIIGMSGQIYFCGALLLGIAMLISGVMVSLSKSVVDAKRLLRVSILYLPVLFLLIVTDVSF